ncbi:hypothetical protein F2Q69_00006462 [Brassica cretica]|uniref:Uncharacterized protein n=1 Tax=Brassica cretica TaxID=69181 RepID=A0A8S9PF60_BRACR|nr:hypothetical protein F2Q69_00006462 [Brassica cretica]
MKANELDQVARDLRSWPTLVRNWHAHRKSKWTWKAAKPGTWVITATPAPSKPGPNTNTRVPIRSQDLRENPRFSHDLKVQSRSQEPPGSNYGLRTNQRIFGFPYRLQASFMTQDLEENLRAPPRPRGSGQPQHPKNGLRVLTISSKAKTWVRPSESQLLICDSERCALLPLKKRIVDEDPALKTSLNT